MGILEVIKKGFSIATKNLGLVLILIVFNLIWNLISIPLSQQGPTPAPQVSIMALILGVLFVLISIFIQGGSLGLVRDHIKEGRMKLANLASYGLKYYLRLLGLGALIVLIIAVVGLVAALIVVVTAPLKSTVLTIISTLIAIVVGSIGLYFVFLLILSPYIIICDNLSVINSMKISISKVRSSVLKVLLLLVTLVLISLGIGLIVGFLTGLASVAIPVGVAQIVISIANSIFNGYLGVVMMASFMAFYLALTEKEKTTAQKIF